MLSLIGAAAIAASLTSPPRPAPPPVELIRSIGGHPSAGLLRDKAGNFYGTTETGGAFSAGNVFKLAPDGTYTSVYDFTGGDDGGYPRSDLVSDASGNLYGTTLSGGELSCRPWMPGCGVVFKVAPNGTETVLHTFLGGTDGESPYAGVVMDANENLYGTTFQGGGGGECFDIDGCGTVFKVTPDGVETILHAFAETNDGGYPLVGVILDRKGNLYGSDEGTFGNIFEITAEGTFKRLSTAIGSGSDGRLLRDSSGILYGVSAGGGDSGYGAVFRLEPDGSETILHSFTYTDGAYPEAGLIRDSRGNLYGTTTSGGSGCGTVFKLSPDGQETTLHTFFPNFNIDGCRPLGELLRTKNGNLYGTTYSGGVGDLGTVFVITP
jgi:uncharacterized repeat protein (TIGR03803 family)